MHRAFVSQVRLALEPLADPVRAAPMVAYMKGQFPFLGVPTPLRRQASKPLIKSFQGDLIAAAQGLWQLPEREYQYVACDLLRQYANRLTPGDLNGLRGLILDRSWWDTVDGLAVTVGEIIRQFPGQINLMDEWIHAESLWLRRVALLHQLNWKSQTDSRRLFDYCLLRASDKDFFMRKAIGWALRQYARVDSEAVFQFVCRNKPKLSALSIREALKHVEGQP